MGHTEPELATSFDLKDLRPVAGRMAVAAAVIGMAVLWPFATLLDTTATGTAIATALYVCATVAVVVLANRFYAYDRVGTANLITLLRLAMIMALVATLFSPPLLRDPTSAWVISSFALVALVFDGFDGFFARRQGLSSAYGARFDIEVDSAFALILSVMVFLAGKAGIWVLALGLPRYLFIGAGLVLPWLMAELPERFSRKLVCVIQVGALIGLASPLGAHPASWWVAVCVSAMVVWSFLVDIIWLARHKS
ncbi:CDP-alcohol phosphatidyltransferase family protein [Devosia pacifica]|uniref:CDP-alcohol phosphatidyltransferase family protein n=1 Tax=Devosia pacifica TaxID=1335967 RepID=UPI00167BDCD6|nr:CDP-alcohol phosphatidyltransferase family protein [Devosia pacifica]